MFIKENLNPQNKNVGDCVIRAISKVLNQSWGRTYLELAVYGYSMADLQSADAVWGRVQKGCATHGLPELLNRERVLGTVWRGTLFIICWRTRHSQH